MTSWLVVGHGSVGAALTKRMDEVGIRPSIYDPSPRIRVVNGDPLAEGELGGKRFDNVICCVVPMLAAQALETVRPALSPATLYFDWNTLPPQAKKQIASAAPCRFIDVALLDTLDGQSVNPTLAISGADEAAAPAIAALGFHVDVVGTEPGDAARLKLARSLFMKSLEALVVEFEAAVAPLQGRDVIVASIERNLGRQFTDFARMLIETDRIHAMRRADELEGAVAAYSARSVRVPTAAIAVLRAAAAAWQAPDAPAADAGATAFARHLATRLDRE